MKYLFVSSLFGATLNLLSIPLLYFLFDSDFVGSIAIYNAIAIPISSIIGLRLDLSLVRINSRYLRISVLKYTTFISFVFSFIISLTATGLCFYIGFIDNILPSFGIIFSMSYVVFLLSLYSNFLLSIEDYVLMSILEFTKNIFPVYSFIISGILFNEINFFLYYIYMVILLIFTIIYWYKNKIVTKASPKKTILRIKRIFYINRNLILSSVPSILINTLTLNIPILLTGQYYGKSNAGFLYNSCRLLNGPIQVLANPIRNVFYKKLSNIYKLKNHRNIVKLFYKYFVCCVLVSIVSYGLLNLLLYYIDQDIIHENIIKYSNIITPFFIVKFIVFTTSNITLVYRKELWVLYWNILYFLSLSAALYYLGTTYYSLFFWLTSYSILSIIFYTFLWLFHLRLILNRSDV